MLLGDAATGVASDGHVPASRRVQQRGRLVPRLHFGGEVRQCGRAPERLHKWNECVPNTKVKNRIRPRQAATKVGPLGEENPDRVLDDWQRLKLKEMIESNREGIGSRGHLRGRHWNAARGTWVQDAASDDSARSQMGCFAAGVVGINLKTSPWSQTNILGCDGDGSFTAFGLKTSESGSLAGVWSSGDVIEVNIDRSELRRRICEISVS